MKKEPRYLQLNGTTGIIENATFISILVVSGSIVLSNALGETITLNQSQVGVITFPYIPNIIWSNININATSGSCLVFYIL